jgi:hypothetical protein
VPDSLRESIFGSIAPGGTYTLNNFPIMRLSQLTRQPLSDLTASGRDSETGSATIMMNCTLQFFGHTFSGKSVASETKSFTVEFVP